MQSTRQPRVTRNAVRIAILAAVAVLAWTPPAQAYIGPGAGFAVLGSALVFVLAMLSAIVTIFTWPIRWVIRSIRGRKALAKARIKRVVVLGLDGMEPTLVDKYVAEGRMPNFVKLRAQGGFRKLGTTLPPLSPVAWSSFLTGCNPGKHNIFDFLTIDRRNYLPALSSVHIGGATKSLKIGKYVIPLGKPDLRLLRKGTPFWNYLGDHDIFSDVIRVPITWPPEKFRGVLLSAMCVPDLRGSQGTFSYYTTRKRDEVPYTGGEQIYVERKGDTIDSHLVGPPNSMRVEGGDMRTGFTVRIDGPDAATLTLCGKTYPLKRGEYTPWLKFHFEASPIAKVRGICQFLLMNTEPHFELYVTPLQIDPEEPAMPIAHPTVYSTYLAKSQGSFATLGLAEDTWALNEKILQDPGFLHQCVEADSERETMFFDAISKTKRGMVCCVFDGTDRIQHMYWRYIDPEHPAREGFGEVRLRDAIPEHYARMDALVGKTMAACADPDTLLLVISDHGFKTFRYGIDLNRWLIENGYMVLKEPPNGKRYLATVDWSKTRAYAQGLAGIFLNIAGRETNGIVTAGVEADALRDELCAKLTGLMDPRHNAVAINTAYNTHKFYKGPYTEHAPDVICGYAEGYRVSWEAAVGDVTDAVFHDNTKAWSGDHCVDPKIVPGIMFSNRPITDEHPRLLDLGPTILDLFGIPVPKHMDGKPLTVQLNRPAAAPTP
ncbi:MAG TPA: alkaline phosphatase family protein [Phycisphaerae bacterium]|nr:alkaline phosphatase family protein [Phycisphaerales bacterium]HRX83631.1 alkaline phosphatase family protein [Phycisphaerae bacterium]